MTFAAILSGAAVAVTGCSGGAGASGAPAGPAAVPTQTFTVSKNEQLAAMVPEAVRKTGAFTVGVALGSPPDEFRDPAGKIAGWEVDISMAVADLLGLKADLKPDSFDSLIPGLRAERYDAAIGQIAVTGAREKVVDQISTAKADEGMAALKSAGLSIKTLDDLCGLTVATTRGSREVEFANAQNAKCEKNGKKPVTLNVFEDSTQAGLAMMSQRVSITWSGSTAISYFVQTTNGKAEVVGHYLAANPLGFALAKNSPMSKPVQAAVQRLIDDGTYSKIMEKWGLSENKIATADLNPQVG